MRPVPHEEVMRRRRRGENLRRLRAEVAQIEMAAALGWPSSRLCELEKGYKPLSLKTIEALADIFGMEPWKILQELDK